MPGWPGVNIFGASLGTLNIELSPLSGSVTVWEVRMGAASTLTRPFCYIIGIGNAGCWSMLHAACSPTHSWVVYVHLIDRQSKHASFYELDRVVMLGFVGEFQDGLTFRSLPIPVSYNAQQPS